MNEDSAYRNMRLKTLIHDLEKAKSKEEWNAAFGAFMCLFYSIHKEYINTYLRESDGTGAIVAEINKHFKLLMNS
jgi:hypothetical protein